MSGEAAAVLEEAIDAKRAACLIMIRHLVVKQQEVALSTHQRTAKEEEGAQMLAAVVGLGEDHGWQRDPFTLLMDLLLPAWSTLRKPLGGYREALQWEQENEDDSEKDEQEEFEVESDEEEEEEEDEEEEG